MNEIKVSAKTLEEAITKACVELGVTSDNLEYTVIDKGSKGIFGLGARLCVIFAGEKKKGINDQRKKIDRKLKQERNIEVDKNNNDNKKAKSTVKTVAKESQEDKKFQIKNNVNSKEEEINCDENPGLIDNNSIRKEDSRNKEKREKAHRKKKEKFSRRVYSSFIKKEREEKPVELKEDPAERAKNFLDSLFRVMDINVDVSGMYDVGKGELKINLSGEDINLILGRRGQTLDALQYLTAQIVNKRQTAYIKVRLDIENYREKRKKGLESLALDMAKKVVESNRPMVLEAMNAYERRIIHSILQSEEGVKTHSEGEEPYRHVVITPEKRERNYEL